MTEKHPREMTFATKEQTTKYMDEAVEFVTKRTGIAEDTLKVMLEKLPNPILGLAVAEFVVYMAVYSVAEKAAQADGLTLRDWNMAEAAGAPSASPTTTIVPGPETRQ